MNPHRCILQCCVALGLALPGPVLALADVSGSVEITTGNFVPPGSLARVLLTIANNGPDTEQNVVMGTFYSATVGFRSIEILPTAETAPCLVQYTDFTLPPPGISTVVVTIQTLRSLGPGEVIACVVGLITYPEAPALIQQRFDFGFPDNDPNPDNNHVQLEIRSRAAVSAVPGLSQWGLLLVVTGITLIGVSALGKNRRLSA